MKKLITTLAIAFCATVMVSLPNQAHAQSVGINTTPAPSAALDVFSTTKGMLVPRMSTTARNLISSPATGLMVYDNTLNAFYFYNGTAWTAVGGSASGNVPKLELLATKSASTQTLSAAQGTNTGDLIVFDNVATAPTSGSYSTTTNAYTVGAGQAGLYYIEARAVVNDNAVPTNTVGVWFKIEFTPNGGSASFINATDVYGPYPTIANANFPSGLKGRGDISAVVYLNAGDSFVIKGLTGNSSQNSTMKNDGSCKLKVVKMN